MLKYRHLLLLTATFFSPIIMADVVPYEQEPGNSINEIELPLTRGTAAELVKIETGGKILSVEEELHKNNVIYRVKVLHNNGKVKSHRIDRDTGHNIE